MNTKNQKREVYVAIADPKRRELIRFLAGAEALPLQEFSAQLQMGLYCCFYTFDYS
ncbi:hypothetical protein AB1L05_11940 [Cytobacillus horneckiae]|uniref:hypothetical protein n=1 Tax=Cytobacillus horneckiae TaxID=549687 RepID=UPI0030B8585A